jgi:adenylyltransferase/sulfurtransferase
LDQKVLDVNASTIESLVQNQDLILDGTDNFETRYLINDASQKWRIPWIYGACVGAYGLSVAFLPGATPCLRCILEHLPPPGSSPTCDTSGIIGPIVHLVAALQSAEALKILTGNAQQLSGKLISMDVWENQILSLDLENFQRDPDCPACGRGRLEFLNGEQEGRAQHLCGRDAVQIRRATPQSIDFQSIAERLNRLGEVTYNEFMLRAVIEDYEIALFADGRGIVRGTQDVDEAKRIYARYVGN